MTQEWRPSPTYPDPAVQILDPRFATMRVTLAAVERLYTGCRWAEGPVWFGDQRAVFWSDIPNNRILRWSESTGAVDEFRRPSNYTNGNTRDRQGRLISCEHGGRRVTRTEYDGTITVLADSFDGKRLNSPNDVVVKRDGTVWFTDPEFGILGYYEGARATPELPTNVYRYDPETNRLDVVIDDIVRPNGICFSPDESIVYIVDCGTTPRRILAYDVNGARVTNKRVFTDAGEGTPDGFRCDTQGNLWAGWGMNEALNGVRIFAPDATPIGHIALPERCANLCFGGLHRNRLFMASSQSLYALYVGVQGV
jgi:gluconolactonase